MTLLDDFVKAAKEVAIDLEMNEERIEFHRAETPKVGLDYTAMSSEDAKGFDFHLRTRTEEQDPTSGEMEAFLGINFAEGVAAYVFHENINYIKGHPDFLSRWVSWAIFNFRKEHEKINLQSLFYDVTIRIYGIPGYCDPAEAEAILLFNSLLESQKDKVLIYRFRHIRRETFLQRSLSYAVLVRTKIGYPQFWVVFPNNCGMDSGRAHSTYLRFESLIEMLSQRLDVEIQRYDIEYAELDRFLLKNASGFFSILRESNLDWLYYYWEPSQALTGSEEQFQKFRERLEKKEYAQALRDLRALVQQAQENVAKHKNLDYSVVRDPNINKLASFLVKEKQLEGRLLPWFAAFTSFANLASHRDFPTEQDMRNEITRTRVLLTFYLGIKMLQELDAVLSSERYSGFDDLS